MQNIFGVGGGGGGGGGANKVHYGRCTSGDLLFKKPRCPRHCCCCLSSAISTVDNGTLKRESDSKAT